MNRLRKTVPRNIVLCAFPRIRTSCRSMWWFRMSLMQVPIPVPAPPLACVMALAWRLPPGEAAIAPIRINPGDAVFDRIFASFDSALAQVGDRVEVPSSGTG